MHGKYFIQLNDTGSVVAIHAERPREKSRSPFHIKTDENIHLEYQLQQCFHLTEDQSLGDGHLTCSAGESDDHRSALRSHGEDGHIRNA